MKEENKVNWNIIEEEIKIPDSNNIKTNLDLEELKNLKDLYENDIHHTDKYTGNSFDTINNSKNNKIRKIVVIIFSITLLISGIICTSMIPKQFGYITNMIASLNLINATIISISIIFEIIAIVIMVAVSIYMIFEQ